MAINWEKLGRVFARLCIGMSLVIMGLLVINDSGERTYNKYLHSVRKMYMPNSKPSDQALAGKTYDEFNQLLIAVHGVLLIIAGTGFLFLKQGLAALSLLLSCAFMMATKDNYWIQSNVSAI